MKNLKVSRKLIISFVGVIILAVIVGAIGIIGMNSLSTAQSNLYDNHLIAVEAMGNLRELFANERNAMRTIILHRDDPQRVQSVMNGFNEYDRVATENFAQYEGTITDDSTESAYFTAKQTWWGDYADLKRDCFNLINAGQFDEAYDLYTSVGAPIIAPITTGFEESAALNAQWAEEANIAGDNLYSSLTLVLVIVLIVSIAAAIILALYISNLISKPLIPLTNFMKKAGATGDITIDPAVAETINKYGRRKDEIGQCISATTTFMERLTQTSKELELISSGDLTSNINLLSESDTMGSSLKQMADNLNDMFAEIQLSTNQVSTGSKQVADGAQSLAQGATEQAAAIEELSSSIAEIAKSTKRNAETAGKTSKLSVTIKENAEKGSRQMDEMITAVKDINEASQAIGKIIKTIDDIAFQTNILALNAAVEAARAGQHGKGFAVVAEEVLNLAGKSAEAAKDTGLMIQNSMEKAQLGSRIAGETAESLNEIVAGINESGQLVNEIAKSSEEQSLGISQINTGIEQVAQVVQQNSATAEQSAAASQEMSGQSGLLEELIARFKLKGEKQMRRSLTSGDEAPRTLSASQKENALSYSLSGVGGFGKY